MLHMIVHIREVDLRLMAHISYDLDGCLRVCGVHERGTPVNVVSTETVDDGLDGTEGTLVQDQVTRKNVH